MAKDLYDSPETTYDDVTMVYDPAQPIKHPAALELDVEGQAIWTVKQGVAA